MSVWPDREREIRERCAAVRWDKWGSYGYGEAHYCEDVDDLLDEVERLRGQNATMREALDRRRQDYLNILEFRQLPAVLWDEEMKAGHGERFGALTRKEIELALADCDTTLRSTDTLGDAIAAARREGAIEALEEIAKDLRCGGLAVQLLVDYRSYCDAYGFDRGAVHELANTRMSVIDATAVWKRIAALRPAKGREVSNG